MITIAQAKVGLSNWIAGGFVPEQRSRWEWAIMRLLLALLVFHCLQEAKPFTFDEQSVPRGLARVVNLTFLHQPGPIDLHSWGRWQVPLIGEIRWDGPGWFDTFAIAALVLGALYTWGKGLRYVLPALTLLHILPFTLNNSQGYTHHGFQLVSMVLIMQSFIVWWWRPERRWDLASSMAYYSTGVVAVSYFTCAVTKIFNSKGLWLWKSNYICIELIKSHRLAYYERLDPAQAGDPASALWLLNHPWITRLLFDAGFCLELGAIIALRDRTWALIVGLSIIAFHRGVWALMKLQFPMHEWLVLIFLINVPYWAWRATQRGNSLAR
jgi:hypothetical protein